MPNLAFIFPGQGSQSIGMGREIYENFAPARELLDSASSALGLDFAHLLFEPNDEQNISEFTQPAIVLCSMMALRAWQSECDTAPSALFGHSLGEFSALCAAGAFGVNETLSLVRRRGALMAQACEGKSAGMMVVLGLGDEVVESIVATAQSDGKSVFCANYNCDGQIVLAGARADLETLVEPLKSAGAKRAMLLNMSVASHCPMLQSASDALQSELSHIAVAPNFAPVVSNVTASPYNTREQAISLLAEQLVSPVRYKQSVRAVEPQIDAFIEFGASVLSGINRKITSKPTFSVTDAGTLAAALAEVAKL